ncbi:DUF7919 family protein [Taibaiella soli]|uniref:DUF7919 domain-containing protein n=1 Tax=Taibaiella soli TaxID=1649169 RepID=A0A2W2ANH0_9BACT|nr:hypothetical protein [Taibaiella soli]PZF73900.1 hypothetical protein DN068_06040 [Taibaiella soli]
MFFKDFTEYKNTKGRVLHIGWLEPEHDYEKGEVDEKVVKKLIALHDREATCLTRGVHLCGFCPPERGWVYLQEGKHRILGHAEIWVPNNDQAKTFAAPSLIIHYILEHGYRPPQEFIDAVMGFDLNSDWSGDQTWMDLMDDWYGPQDWGDF